MVIAQTAIWSLCSNARRRNLFDHSDVLQNKEDVLQVAKVSRGSRNTHVNHIGRQVDDDDGHADVEDEDDHDHCGGSGDGDNGDDNFLDPVSGVQRDSWSSRSVPSQQPGNLLRWDRIQLW